MAAAAASQRSRAGSRVAAAAAQYDQDGRLIEVETREDEEQGVKLSEIIELLVAAGYFRARIKGLSSFDKVVGGMTWCITTCSVDIDVDLLFQENSTIGQKIALTEKIVSVLPSMKCPHRIEPHQIQGLDFIHIFPVIQWLVKRAIETREETGDHIRAFSISQFNKSRRLPEDEEFLERKGKATMALLAAAEEYKPQRRYRRQVGTDSLLDEESRVQSTLLEYGRRYCFIQNKNEKVDDRKKSVPGATVVGKAQTTEEEELQAADEIRIKTLMSSMAAMATEEGRLTASTVGQIVGLQSEEIKQIASEYAEKQSELAGEEKTERLGPVQQHKRLVVSLGKQISQKELQLEEIKAKHTELKVAFEAAKEKLMEVEKQGDSLRKEMGQLDSMESQADSASRENFSGRRLYRKTQRKQGEFLRKETLPKDPKKAGRISQEGDFTERPKDVLQKLRALVAMNESLKSQEHEFRAHCKEELTRLQSSIEELKLQTNNTTGEEAEQDQLIEKQYRTDIDKLQKIRMLLGRRNREIAILQRKIDEVPSRAELTQYQRRFVELYSQVAATHKETKQFYTLYNTLDDKKLYLEKEVNLLNSIHDNFQQAMASQGGREQFLKQLEQIVEGIKQSRVKVEKKRQENKMRRDQLNDEHLDLLDKQRLYFKTVKDFKEECRKNEILLSKLRAKNMA